MSQLHYRFIRAASVSRDAVHMVEGGTGHVQEMVAYRPVAKRKLQNQS